MKQNDFSGRVRQNGSSNQASPRFRQVRKNIPSGGLAESGAYTPETATKFTNETGYFLLTEGRAYKTFIVAKR
jgi:hypothetical protein